MNKRKAFDFESANDKTKINQPEIKPAEFIVWQTGCEHPWLIHVNVWQKPLQYCRVISLQLK